MKHHGKLLTGGLLLVCTIALTSGCIAVAVGVADGAGYGTAQYINGNTEGLLPTPPQRVVAVVMGVFVDNDIELKKKRASDDASKIKLKGKLINGDTVTVTIKQQGPQVSKLSVRVGLFGNQIVSDPLFMRIRERVVGE